MDFRAVGEGRPNARLFAFVPSREREKKFGQIFNAHPLDFFHANFDVPEVYCFAAGQRAI